MDLEESWEPETRFNLYLHDYMVNKNMKTSASIFKHEAKLPDHSVAIDDSEKGLLNDWWSLFSDVFAKTHFRSNDEDEPETSFQAMQRENSIQPHLETRGQISGSSSGTPRPSLNIPNTSSSTRINSRTLPHVEGIIFTTRGRITAPAPPGPDDLEELGRMLDRARENGWPVNEPTGRQQVIFPRASSSTRRNRASSSTPRNRASSSTRRTRASSSRNSADNSRSK